MRDRWIGPMPADDFLETFLPNPTNKPLPSFTDAFQHIPTGSVETARYDPFIKAIQPLVPDLIAVNTGNKGKQELKPGICFYDADGDSTPQAPDFDRMELWIEFKKGKESVAFQDPKSEFHPAAVQERRFTPGTKMAQEIREQLADYASAHHSHQFRHFSFAVLVTDSHARFLRWDTAGAIVSSAFQYCSNPTLLATFLWRFNHLVHKDRGRDMSVRPATLDPDIAARIRDKLVIDDQAVQIFEYDIPGLLEWGHAYGPRPAPPNRSIAGRCTKTVPLIWIPNSAKSLQRGDSESNPSDWAKEQRVFLKDTWRYISSSSNEDILQEHEVYKRLSDVGTPNIPELFAGGDVDGGLTQTQAFVHQAWLSATPQVSAFWHYRLVLGVIGHPLTTFKSTKELTSVVLDAVKAHSHAYEVAGILHRDISPGNIISMDEGRGLLIDWESAKDCTKFGNRRPDRTGTWQFMSANLLQHIGKHHTLADDLESFIHVLGWSMLSFVPAKETYLPINRWHDLVAFEESKCQGGFELGGNQKVLLFIQGQFPSRDFKPRQPTPLFNLVRSLILIFKSLYVDPPSDTDRQLYEWIREQAGPEAQWHTTHSVPVYDSNMQRLSSSQWFIKEMEEALNNPANDWPGNDGAVKLPIQRDSYVHEILHQSLIRTSQRIHGLEDWERSKGVQPMGSKRPHTSTSPGPSAPAKRQHYLW